TCEIPDAYSSDHPVEIFNNSDSENATTPHPDAVNSIKVSDNTISIDNVEGHEFEYLCADLLSKNGYEDVTVTQGSADQGIDVIAQRDGIKFGIQCKCYSSDIGNKAVQEAYAGKDFYKCHVGIVLTNRYFTRSAVELAKSNGIVLWNREKLLEFVKGAGYEVR
ncbi:MAG: restriction endonuclease, partial [Clostridiales bacterium]|nr:restriction endonuclease [Clostridiales bacterium]